MGSVQLLLGKTRLRRRRAIPASHLSGVDPFGHPTFLYVTGTWRKRLTVEQEFLAWRSAAPTFAPHVRTLGEIVDTLWQRHGDGRAILSPRAAALVAARLLDERGSDWPRLAALGRPMVVGEALAALHARMGEAFVSDLPDKAADGELGSALRALGRAIAALPGHAPRHEAIAGVIARLSRPPPALVQWLRATHSVLIDDLLQPSAVEQALIVALCRAWDTAGTHVVVAFESGRGLGGAEAGPFFGWEEEAVPASQKPFAATAGLRRALFEELVASGGEARVTVASEDGVAEVDDGLFARAVDPEELPDRVYGDGARTPWDVAPEAVLGERVRLRRYADADAEIAGVASAVRAALAEGVAPQDCLVAVAGLGGRLPSVRAAFADAEVPVSIATGAPLAESPVAHVARAVATLALRGWPADVLADLLASDLVASPVDGRTVARARQAAGIRAGRPSTWADALARRRARSRGEEADPVDVDALDAFVAPLAALAEPADPRAWRARLLEALTALGVAGRVGRGPVPDDLRAWGALVEALDALVRDLEAVHAGAWPAETLAAAFVRAVGAAAIADPPSPGKVAVVDATDLRGLTPRRCWLAGLVAGAFPRPRSGSFLVPSDVDRVLDPGDALAEARYLLLSLLRNALGDAGMRVDVSWPAAIDGHPAAPSPVLADVLAVPLLVDGRPKALGDVLVEDAAPTSGGRSARRRAAALAGEPDRLGADAPLAARQAEAARSREAPGFGPWDGLLDAPPPARSKLPVTALEAYLRCPARYAYGHVLKLAADEDWDPELDAARRGAAVHAMLERFYRERDLEPVQGLSASERAEAARRLHGAADAVLDDVEAQGGVSPAWFVAERARWLDGLVDGRPAGTLKTWLDSEADLPVRLEPIAVESAAKEIRLGPVRLVGRLDRVDRVAGGFLVTDYKTGAPPSIDLVRRGLSLQPVAYAAAIGEERVATSFVDLRRADAVARTGWTGDPELVRLLAPRGRRLPLDAEGRDRLLAHAAHAAERLAAGVFHPTLATEEEAGCGHCPFRRICRVDFARPAGPGDWQAPIEADGSGRGGIGDRRPNIEPSSTGPVAAGADEAAWRPSSVSRSEVDADAGEGEP